MKSILQFIKEGKTSSKTLLSSYSVDYDIASLETKLNKSLTNKPIDLFVTLGKYKTNINNKLNRIKYNARNNSMFIGFIIENAISSFLESEYSATPKQNLKNIGIDNDDYYTLCDSALDGKSVEIKSFSRQTEEQEDGIYIKKGVKMTQNQINSCKKSIIILCQYSVNENNAIIEKIYVRNPNQIIIGETSILKILN